MKLSDVELIPGEIFNVADPMKIGRVKAEAPGLWARSTMKDKAIPWLWPIVMHGSQRFSKLFAHRKVWVLKIENSEHEWYYIPIPEYYEETTAILDDYDNPEVLLARNMGTNSVYIYYNDKDGLMLKYGDTGILNMNPDSTLTLKFGDAKVFMKGNHVYIGDGEKGEPAVMGDKLKSMLQNVSKYLASAGAKCAGPYLASAAGADLTQAAISINQALSQLLAQNTNVD